MRQAVQILWTSSPNPSDKLSESFGQALRIFRISCLILSDSPLLTDIREFTALGQVFPVCPDGSPCLQFKPASMERPDSAPVATQIAVCLGRGSAGLGGENRSLSGEKRSYLINYFSFFAEKRYNHINENKNIQCYIYAPRFF